MSKENCFGNTKAKKREPPPPLLSCFNKQRNGLNNFKAIPNSFEVFQRFILYLKDCWEPPLFQDKAGSEQQKDSRQPAAFECDKDFKASGDS